MSEIQFASAIHDLDSYTPVYSPCVVPLVYGRRSSCDKGRPALILNRLPGALMSCQVRFRSQKFKIHEASDLLPISGKMSTSSGRL